MVRRASRSRSTARLAALFSLIGAGALGGEPLDVGVVLSQPGVQVLLVSHYAPGCARCAAPAGTLKALGAAFHRAGLRLAAVTVEQSGQCVAPPWEVDDLVCPAGAAARSPGFEVWSWQGKRLAQGDDPAAIDAAVRRWFAQPQEVAVRLVGDAPKELAAQVEAELGRSGKLTVMAAPKSASFLAAVDPALAAARTAGLTECQGGDPRQVVAEVRLLSFLGGDRLDLLLLSPQPACVLASGSASYPGRSGAEAVRVAVARLLDGLRGEVTGPAPPANEAQVEGAWGGDMVRVAAGDSWMGSNEGEDDQRPRRRVYLDAFSIDQYEVSAASYDVCVDQKGCSPAGTTPGCTSRVKGKENHPINCITWEQAKQFCAFAEKRLPTEAEWEKAARGPGGVRVMEAWEAPVSTTGPIDGLHLSVSPYGARGMSDNVWEWVADWYDRDSYALMPSTNPTGPTTGTERVIRGGSLGHIVRSDLRTTYRMHFVPTLVGVAVGVRCARSKPQ